MVRPLPGWKSVFQITSLCSFTSSMSRSPDNSKWWTIKTEHTGIILCSHYKKWLEIKLLWLFLIQKCWLSPCASFFVPYCWRYCSHPARLLDIKACQFHGWKQLVDVHTSTKGAGRRGGEGPRKRPHQRPPRRFRLCSFSSSTEVTLIPLPNPHCTEG